MAPLAGETTVSFVNRLLLVVEQDGQAKSAERPWASAQGLVLSTGADKEFSVRALVALEMNFQAGDFRTTLGQSADLVQELLLALLCS
jgi:hypothetical protein